LACKQSNLPAARFLLDNGADVNAANLEKMTGNLFPLMKIFIVFGLV
jgi:ankyrin repeat protein